MRTIRPDQFDPVVRHANEIPVPPGKFWGPRTIPDLELIYGLAGRFFYRDETGADLLFGADELLLIPPEVVHTVGWHRGRTARFACIHCEPLPDRRYAEGTYRMTPPPKLLTATGRDPLLRGLFAQAARAMLGSGKFRQELLSSLARAIWLRLAEYWQTDAAEAGPSVRVRRMAEFLEQRYRDPVGRRDLAEQFHLTPQYINALFRKELGVTPVEFLHRLRVEKALPLLRRGKSVREVAEAVGFGDAFYFSRIFRRLQGVPPGKIAQRRPQH